MLINKYNIAGFFGVFIFVQSSVFGENKTDQERLYTTLDSLHHKYIILSVTANDDKSVTTNRNGIEELIKGLDTLQKSCSKAFKDSTEGENRFTFSCNTYKNALIQFKDSLHTLTKSKKYWDRQIITDLKEACILAFEELTHHFEKLSALDVKIDTSKYFSTTNYFIIIPRDSIVLQTPLEKETNPSETLYMYHFNIGGSQTYSFLRISFGKQEAIGIELYKGVQTSSKESGWSLLYHDTFFPLMIGWGFTVLHKNNTNYASPAVTIQYLYKELTVGISQSPLYKTAVFMGYNF